MNLLKKKLGDILVDEKLITQHELEHALVEQKNKRGRLGRVLIDLKYVDEDDLLNFLSEQLKIPVMDLSQEHLEPKVLEIIPESQARRHRAIALEADDKTVVVGMSDPADINAVDAIKQVVSPLNLQLCIVRESDILNACDNFYRKTQEINRFAQQLQEDNQDIINEFNIEIPREDTENTIIAKMIRKIFEDALQLSASDIHIEPEKDIIRLRLRVDGRLNESIINEKDIAASIVTRIKIMSELNIAEKRLPQDGRFNINVNRVPIDVRVSTVPVEHGEGVVMRLLDQSKGNVTLDSMGMEPELLERFKHLITRPHGIILVTGPTGSGKTTTLYSALHELNDPETKIITAEDPVEYRMERITQIQINEKIGLTFASVLRAALRQDPDVVLVGEMRDQETAEIGLRASITGHLVLSTLHTNDTISSITRLIDMGAEDYLVSSSVKGVLAQRLIKRICKNCKIKHILTETEKKWLDKIAGKKVEEQNFYKGAGCNNCNNRGFKGRVPVFELLEIDHKLQELLKDFKKNGNQEFEKAVLANPRFKTLAQDAIRVASFGIAPISEVFELTEILPD